METLDRPGLGIIFILAGTIAISLNDLLIKYLSGGYPLHQMIFIRAVIGLGFTLALVQLEGGWRILRTGRPWIQVLRGVMIVSANLCYYAAMAVMPLGQVTALFFVAPLFITVLSIPFLGEQVGPFRITAVLFGFAGVLVMQQPWAAQSSQVSLLVTCLPVIAAAFYASLQVLTRKLGVTTKASAMALYMQVSFITVAGLAYLAVGDGRYAQGISDESLLFLLRAWQMPTPRDWMIFIGLGLCSGAVGYCLTSAYRLTKAATVAPFEYVGLPLAIFWGWLVVGEWPSGAMWIGCAMIIGAGRVGFLREQATQSPQPGRRARWGRR
jgi:S-adenosylmethionine uptake transporter